MPKSFPGVWWNLNIDSSSIPDFVFHHLGYHRITNQNILILINLLFDKDQYWIKTKKPANAWVRTKQVVMIRNWVTVSVRIEIKGKLRPSLVIFSQEVLFPFGSSNNIILIHENYYLLKYGEVIQTERVIS